MLLKKSIPIKRNQPCPCGSGKKLKHCCIGIIKEVQKAVEMGISSEIIMSRQLFKKPLIQEQGSND